MNANTNSARRAPTTLAFAMSDTNFEDFEDNMLYAGVLTGAIIDAAYDRFKAFHLETERDMGEATTIVTVTTTHTGERTITFASDDPGEFTHNGRFWA